MIEELRIGSLGVIESSVLELGPGLTVITGETGAGKTMIVTALGLLLGARADSGAVRSQARQARVEGVLSVGGLDDVAAAVDEAGGEVEDGAVVVARTVAAEGRSRAFVGGAGVPVATLAALTQPLVAVHGQSDQHRLLAARAQRDALDRFAGAAVGEPLAHYRDVLARLEQCEAALADVVASARERAREADLLRFGLGEVDAVEPQPDEEADLLSEESRLGYADALRGAADQAREHLSADAGTDALALVATARGLLDGVRDHDREAAGLADRLAEIGYLVADVAADLASYASGIDTDPQRLAAVSERRAALLGLTRKYGETIAEVLVWAESARERLEDLDSTDEQIDTLRATRAELRDRLAEHAAAVSAERTRAAARLSERVGQELGLLAMPHARVVVEVGQREVPVDDAEADAGPRAPLEIAGRRLRYGSSGVDDVELLLAANTGSEPRPLAKGASGGELSRVMLALEVCLAETSPVPTFVFDEVDAGVGGAAAVEVGRRLAQLACSSQVLVVTHLPQVAAYADRHVLVRKSSDGSVTSSGLEVLDDTARERELSRMLAGQADSDTALAHARELLETATSWSAG